MSTPGTDTASDHARAVELLQAPDDPGAFGQAVALIERAAGAGHADALARLATIEAVGAGRPQNWAHALDLLARAAESGSAGAQAQLRLLSEATTDASDWRSMRSGIDIARLLRVPDRESLAEQPRVRVMRDFASAAECRWIIDRARSRLAPAKIWDAVSGVGVEDPSRSNSALELSFADLDVVTEVIRARISLATRLPEPIFETSQVLHYAVGQEFRPHYDFLDQGKAGHAADVAQRGQRIATFILYLNEGFQGGETEFPNAGLSFAGRRGDALFWANVLTNGQPDPMTLHAGRPPTSGEKWIFSQWIRDRSPGPPPG